MTHRRHIHHLVASVVVAAAAGHLAASSVAASATAAPPLSVPPTVHTDFNGDGFADLAIGVPFEDVNALSDAGAVNVLYGSAGGLQVDAPADQFWNQDSPGVREKSEAGDVFGWALASGDFDGDGYADLAIGDPDEDVNGKFSSGAVAVLYGSAGGLQADAPDDDYWNQDSTGVRGEAETSDFFGGALAAGDFDNDGFADLAIGVSQESIGTKTRAGAVNVLYGSAGGLQATSPDDDYWTQDSTGVRDNAEANDAFGAALTTADFDGDGFADLGIGIPGEDVGTLDSAGAVAVLYGGNGGLQADAPDDDYWNQNSTGVQDQAESPDTFGSALAGADFNHDGFSDLAIGVPNEGVGSVSFAGAADVLYGSAAGLQATSPDDQFWNQDSPGVQDQAEMIDLFGTTVAAGDLNGDGFADLMVGVTAERLMFSGSGGAANVLYGTAAGLQADSPDDQFWNEDSPGVQGDNGFDWAAGLAVDDFNGDGFADMATGIPGQDVGSVTDAGAVSVLFGTAAGLQADAPDDQFWDQDSPGVEDQAESDDELGEPVA